MSVSISSLKYSAVGIQTEAPSSSSKRGFRVLAWIVGVGCSIPILCIGVIALMTAFGVFTGTPGNVDENPSWSPDGQQIAFDSNRDGNYDIYVMNTDGSNIVQLTKSPTALLWELVLISTSGDGYPVWSPDGSQIAFISDRENDMMSYIDHDIYVMRPDGSNVVNLTGMYRNVELRPSWSPDGKHIVFEADRDPTQPTSATVELNWDLYAIDVDGTYVRRLTFSQTGEGQASWSPDGSRVAYVSAQAEECNIYVLDVLNLKTFQLTAGEGSFEQPRWSPDSKRIVFSSNRDGGTWHLFVMDDDGSNMMQLTTGSANEMHPVWSPDGKRIAFASDRDGDLDIYMMNSDGTNIVQLTDE